ncbi:MAG TPA: hypothetical protein VG963_19875 [Polyangiaceae bacterium]|nr:hypothetical protein [Polyangiaceae bacterium]
MSPALPFQPTAASRVFASLVLGFVLLLGMVESARAEADREYDKAIERAVTAYNGGDYDEATRQFQRAHELSPSARTLRGVGMSEFELGHHDRAAEALERALASKVAPLEGDLRTDTERLLREALARVGRLHLEVVPESSEIALDGAARTLEANHLLLVTPGPHLLEAHAPGYERARQPITAEAGRELDLKLALVPLANATESTEERRWYKSPWLWTSVGLVVVAGAVVGGLAASGRFDKKTEEPRTSTGTKIQLLPLRLPL